MNAAADLEAMLTEAWRRSDRIFELLPREALLHRPISLRHPFLFYLGHLPAFAWNQIGRGVLGEGHLDRDFDVLFERGIDPADEAGARAASISGWPPIGDVLAYRDEARRAVLGRIPAVLARTGDVLGEKGRVLHMVVEHELMHHETLLYMLQEHASSVVQRPDDVRPLEVGDGRAAEPIRIPGGRVVLGAALESIEFGWDNEIGRAEIDVPAFTLDSLPVRNSDYLQFLEMLDQGPIDALVPRAWTSDAEGHLVKTVFGPVRFDDAAGWPVQVTGEQARAYAAWCGGRLPTEAELHLAAFGEPGGGTRRHPWGDAAPALVHGNLGFRHWAPVPAGDYPESASAFGVEELVGNGWEWTSTPFAPLPGFVAYARTYPGYSADFFDGAHDVVFGASWATDDKLVRPTFRNWYRRDYPYAFSSFRVARSEAGPHTHA